MADQAPQSPMIQVRRSSERGHFDHGWLNTYHTFSFADYRDPKFMGYRVLRVINEDRVQAGEGFGTHGHRDMEILSYVLSGKLAHKDSMGTASIIHAGDFQRMTAGTGVTHSEFNGSESEPVHFLQIWIIPEKAGLKPGYEQKSFSEAERDGKLRLVASRDGRAGSITIHQDVSIYSAILRPGESVVDRIPEGRYGWIQVVRGALSLNGELLSTSDGAAIIGGGPIELDAPVDGAPAEVLLFDLP